MCIVLLAWLSVNTLAGQQGEPVARDPAPRWGLGVEVAEPVVRAFTSFQNAVNEVNVQASFRPAEQRAWRMAYRYQGQFREATASASPTDSGHVVRIGSSEEQVHQLLFGHSWYVGRSRLRAMIELGVVIGHEQMASLGQDIHVPLGAPINVNAIGTVLEQRSTRYQGLHLGPTYGLGVEYRLHRQLVLQLRVTGGHYWALPLVEEASELIGTYRYGKRSEYVVGSGLFVQFEF
ncbi:MAG: hypothetical protein E6Q44_07130 [Flavobacteriales bacterium]|nr:MAG: hypothetical protein E6Q44_07130 [Flavobacteriales bacterium]